MASGPVRLVLWDFNGTLLDDAVLCVDCLNATRVRRGMPEVPLQYYLDHFGFPVVDFYKKAGFTFETETFTAVAQEWNDLYHQRLWTDVRLHEGTLSVLESMAGLGLRQGILSAYHHVMLTKALAHFKVSVPLDPVLGLDDFHADGKEDLGRSWLESSGLDREGIILIGDTLHDRDVAAAMGIRCALICKGHQASSRLRGAGVPVLSDIREVPAFLARP
ncbi:MAG: HAD hydrolase-like protein [Elusimicrobia bacterium]|nr:HAD hydrolase-like protein [Elusimicrobiota bacterium]